MKPSVPVIAAAILCLIAIVPSAGAQSITGDELLELLTGKATSNPQKTNITEANVMGYLLGLLDAYMVFSARDKSLAWFCVPSAGLSIAEARIAVVKWLERHPERLNEQARILVFHALAEALPCSPR